MKVLQHPSMLQTEAWPLRHRSCGHLRSNSEAEAWCLVPERLKITCRTRPESAHKAGPCGFARRALSLRPCLEVGKAEDPHCIYTAALWWIGDGRLKDDLFQMRNEKNEGGRKVRRATDQKKKAEEQPV